MLDGGGALMGYTQGCCPDNKTDNAYHVVTAGPGVGPTAILDGVTVKNGYADGTTPNHVGGGLLCQDSSPTIRHGIIECNAGSGGGGVAAWNGGAPTITHCTIRYNWGIESDQMANGIGGLNIYLSDAFVSDCTFIGNVGYGNRPGALMVGVCSPTLIRCTFEDNEAPSQGAAAGLWGTPTDVQLIGCTFTQNRVLNSGGIGGAVAISSGCAAALRDCTFTTNEAVSNGGGVAVTGSTSHAKLVQCTFTGNEAPSGGGLSVQSSQATAVNCRFLGNQGQFGGGVFVQSSTGSANLTNCVFSGNVADGKTESLGGGLCVVSSGSATVTNCTLYGNASVAGDVALGGGIYVESATANVRNAVVWGNSTTWGSGETAQIYTWSPVSFSLSYSCVQGWTSGGLGGSYNTDDDPLLADPDGVDNTLGTEDDDLRLTSGSSAIDTASDAAVPDDTFDVDRNGDTSEPLPLDLARGDRFLGTGPTVDMGAYEYLNTGDDLGDPEPPAGGAAAPEPSGTAYIAFAYDALGRRIERSVDSGGASVEVTRYYYDGQNTVLEVDADDAPRRTYVHGAQYVDERVLVRLPTGKEYYYLPRELYSVAALTDEDGAIVEAATYDTYGKVAVYDGAAQAVEESPVGNPYYFTGRRLDLLPLAGGLKQVHDYRARGYDPGNGRFLQRDGVGYADGMNLCEYVRSQPTVGVDPTGFKDNKIVIEYPPGSKIEVNCATPDPEEPGKAPEPCELKNLKPSTGAAKEACEGPLQEARATEGVKKIERKIASQKACKGKPTKIACATCCGGCKGAGAWHVGREVHVCDDQKLSKDDMVKILMHELTHDWQTCRGAPDETCADMLMLEMEAYVAEGMSCEEAFDGAVWSGCYSMRCRASDINVNAARRLIDWCRSQQQKPATQPTSAPLDLPAERWPPELFGRLGSRR